MKPTIYTACLCAPFLAVATTATAAAQSCEPAWDVAIGNPGLSQGFVDAFRVFDDGSGEKLYTSGSFPSVAGVGGTALIARWDRAGDTWQSVGGGLNRGNTNGFVTSLVPFDTGNRVELVAGGFFREAFGVPDTKSIAKWDGQSWSSLGAGFDPNSAQSVWAITTWDGVGGERLYVGGSFPTAGGETAGGIAAWDGEQWFSLGTGIIGNFAPTVFALTSFDDGSGSRLYAGGRFDSIDSVSAPLIARWDGVSWERVGSGLISDNRLFGVESMAIFDDGNGPALYVGGNNFHAPGQPVGNVSKWDGQQWTTVGRRFTGRMTTLMTFDDGTGPALYGGGNALPDINYFARLENGQWVTVGGGVANLVTPPFPSVFALGVWDDALYVGGNFTLAGGISTQGMAAWQGCPAFEPGDVNCDGSIDAFDIEPFLLALFDPDEYAIQFPDCDINTADINGDGSIDAFDIEPFLGLLFP